MKSKIVLAAAVLAVLLAAAVVYAHGAAPAAKKVESVAKKYGEFGKKGGKWLNATLYVATRQLTLRGDGIDANLKIDVVSRNATTIYGRIIYGVGEVKLGGETYAAKTVYGVVGPRGAHITIYTGREVVVIKYIEGQYTAVVKTFGQPGYKTYSGSAQLSIS